MYNNWIPATNFYENNLFIYENNLFMYENNLFIHENYKILGKGLLFMKYFNFCEQSN